MNPFLKALMSGRHETKTESLQKWVSVLQSVYRQYRNSTQASPLQCEEEFIRYPAGKKFSVPNIGEHLSQTHIFSSPNLTMGVRVVTVWF